MAQKAEKYHSKVEIVPYPEVPLEDLYQQQSFWRGIGSKHSRDLLIIFIGVLTVTATVFNAIQELTQSAFWNSQLLAAMLTSGLATFAAIYQLSKLRFSTVDVFSSEILARLRILAADNTVGRIILDADPHHVELRFKQQASGRQASDSALAPSQENHFETFHRRSSDLGALSSIVVDHVTDFYSFHMAARDGLRDLTTTITNFPTERDEIRARVVDVIFMLDLMSYSGMNALDVLIEKPAHKLHSRQVALSVGTQANRYLVENMSPTDHRYPEVTRRNAKYAKLVVALKSAVNPGIFGPRVVPHGAVQKGKHFF